MNQKISNTIGFLVVICFLFSLASCAKSPQLPDISTRDPIKTGNFIAGVLKVTFAQKPAYLKTAKNVIAYAINQMDFDGQQITLSFLFAYPTSSKEQALMVEGIVGLLNVSFEGRGIPLEGQTQEYTDFMWKLLSQVYYRLGDKWTIKP